MQTVEAVDKKNQWITYDLSEENLMKMYITLKITLQVTSNDEKSFLKWTCLYETRDTDVPAPDALKGFASEITSLIDAHWYSHTVDFNVCLFDQSVRKMHKTLKITFQIIPKHGKNFLKWTYIYEKMNADVPPPDALKGFASEITSIVDARYLEMNNKSHGVQA
ncbi:MLP-like protein 34 [Coffea arabica]|uniref:MLP-like protein 34 n=1 Tax=Coffea arabica TaxID=13443 RepID=A0ABM4W903_COFAR